MAEISVTHVPDLKGKLKYLLHGRGGDMPGWKHRITSQRLLAEALSEMGTNTDEPMIARWKPHDDIPNLVHVAPKIGTIFRCDEQSFRLDDYETFKAKTEAAAPSWGALVAAAAVVGTIRAKPAPTQATRPGLYPMGARATDMQHEDELLPVLKAGDLLDAVLPCPLVKKGQLAEERLHVLLFSGDRDGYMNWFPRGRSSKAFKGLDAITSKMEMMRLPAFGGEIKIDVTAQGRHDIVLVISSEMLPTALQGALEEKVENAALEPALKELARWLAPRLQDGRASICHRPYFVKE